MAIRNKDYRILSEELFKNEDQKNELAAKFFHEFNILHSNTFRFVEENYMVMILKCQKISEFFYTSDNPVIISSNKTYKNGNPSDFYELFPDFRKPGIVLQYPMNCEYCIQLIHSNDPFIVKNTDMFDDYLMCKNICPVPSKVVLKINEEMLIGCQKYLYGPTSNFYFALDFLKKNPQYRKKSNIYGLIGYFKDKLNLMEKK